MNAWVNPARISLSLLLMAGLVAVVPPTPAAAAWAPPVGADVAGVTVKPVSVTARPEWTAGSREVTEADLSAAAWPSGSQTVSLTGTTAARTAGKLPVTVTAAGTKAVRIAVDHRDRSGPTVTVSRADEVEQAASARVTVDYRSFARAYGGDWASRLQVRRLSDGVVVPSVNDRRAGTITTTTALAADGAATALTLAAAPSGPDGDYTATSLSSAGTWQVSQQTGGFSWSYPIGVPGAPGGLEPTLDLSYSSQAIDGMTAATNSQGSWIGDGWDLWPGYVERQYRGCDDDKDEKEKADPNNKGVDSGDLCWMSGNASMSLNGSSTELVRDANGRYHGSVDDGSRIEELTGSTGNGDVDGTYWKVTTPDGTQYFFGRNEGRGGSTAGTKTDSVWTVPVYGNHPGEPGHASTFAGSRAQRGWRWNLDHVVDASNNTITYFYGEEGGAYGREANKDKRTTYDRGGYLKRIEYGSRTDAGSSVRPAGRVVFSVADRCVGGSCFDGDGKAVARKWPDTPWDQYCAEAPCTTQFSPTFFTQKRLQKITTQVYAGSGDSYSDVDSWSLNQTYLTAGVNEGLPMYLKSLQHSGLVTSAGGAAVTDPPVTFDPTANVMPNRVDGPADGHSSLFRNRIAAITTESGGQIGVTYSAPDCTRGSLPKQHSNTRRCFPQYYGAEGETPAIDWFHKYVVDRVDVYDNTGGFEHQQTNYRYLDSPAWAYDDSELVKPKKRTWSQYRGYGRVEVRTGTEDGTQSRTEYRYFRGMNGDPQPRTDTERPPTGTPRAVKVADSEGNAADDHPAFAGKLLEEIRYNGVGGAQVGATVTWPAVRATTASSGALRAYQVYTRSQQGRTVLANGTIRRTESTYAVDDDNLITRVDDRGDTAVSTDDTCATTEYATPNRDRWILGSISRAESLRVSCAATPVRPRDVISDARTYYDDATSLTAQPSRGLPTRVEVLTGYSGSTPQYVTTTRTRYDTSGRATSVTDSLGRTTSTAYTPAEGGPVTATTATDAKGFTTLSTLNTALGKPVKVVSDTAVTETTYDGSGRMLAVWAPGRSRSTYPKDPTESYAYKIRNNAPSYTVTRSLTGYGTATYRTSVTLLDGMLRARQTQTQSVSGGRVITDTVYDSRGLPDWTSAPYYDSDRSSAPDTTLVTAQGRTEVPSLTRTVHDGAGRLTDAILLDRGEEKWRTHTDYRGERVTVTPPDGGVATTTVTDGRGRTAELRQYRDRASAGSDDPGTYVRIGYTYDHRGQLTQAVDSGGNTWAYEYDQRGRRTIDRDPDRGVTTSAFDDAGQLTSVTDARGKVVTYGYDALGRRTVMRRDSSTGPKLAEWTYDSLPNGKGELTGSTRYEYDPAGRVSAWTSAVTGYTTGGDPTGAALTVPGDSGLCLSGAADPCTYSTGYTYRSSGDLDQVVNPALGGLPKETVTTLYNPIGLPNGLIGEMAGGNQIYAQSIVYNQLDQLIGQNLGEQGGRVGLAYGIDEATGRRSTFTAVPELKPEVYRLGYDYYDAGMVRSITDSPDEGQAGETQCFSYDFQQRLTEAWTPGSRTCSTARNAGTLGGPAPYWRSYTFDAAGNRRTETVHGSADVTSTYTYPAPGGAAGSKPHAVSSVSGPATQQYGYDAAGNTTCRPTSPTAANDCTTGAASQALTWDSEGELASAGDTGYLYTADGDRLVKRDPAGTTLYLPGGSELRKPASGAATATRYYAHGGSTIAVRTTAGVQWQVSDHQGTATAQVGGDLTVTRRRTLPFGDVRGARPASWAGDKGFVGGTQDSAGLTHLGAREYDSAIGRFVSVDPVIDLADPQQWNGYDYGNNSPVSNADPGGERFCADDQCSPGADFVDNQGTYHDVYNDGKGCTNCRARDTNSAVAASRAEPTYHRVEVARAAATRARSKPKPSCSWHICIPKVAATSWNWAREHRAAIAPFAGIGAGIIFGVGCTALTGGGGAVICGAISGGVSSLVEGAVKGDSVGEVALNTVTGTAFGGLTGGLGRIPTARIAKKAADQRILTALGKSLTPERMREAEKIVASVGLRHFMGDEAVASARLLGPRAIADTHRRGLMKVSAREFTRNVRRPSVAVNVGIAVVAPGDWSEARSYRLRPENGIQPLLEGGVR